MRGGKREGAGRKPTTFKTKVLYIRVPEHMHTELISMVKSAIKHKNSIK